MPVKFPVCRFFTFSLALIASALPAQAKTVWAEGVSKSRGWVDINKNWKTDKFQCWAASAANIIDWWQQKIDKNKIPAGTPQGPDAVFAAISGAFLDCGRGADVAWKWYFGGCDLAEVSYSRDFRDPEKARTGGRFWQNNILRRYGWAEPRDGVPAYIEGGFAVDITPDQRLADSLAETFVRLFEAGKGISISLTPGGEFPQGHAVTLWGIEYNKNKIKAVYITDSDDRVKELKKYDVFYVTTTETAGDGKADGTPITRWEKTSIRLKNYHGSNNYGIQSWSALSLPIPRKTIPGKK